jgi:hypothetical protein
MLPDITTTQLSRTALVSEFSGAGVIDHLLPLNP